MWKKIWWGLLIVNLLIIIGYWINGSGSLLVSGGLTGVLIAFGRLTGLLAAYTVLLQFLFMGRMVYLERVFGLDKLSVIHHTSGKLSLIFILLHPLFLVAGYGLGTIVSDFEHMLLAFIGFILFVTVVVSSLYIVRKRMRYEAWYFVHLLAYVAVFSSFWHQFSGGGDLLASKFFYGYWVFLYVAVFLSHLIFRFIRPLYLYKQHGFNVSRVVRENHSTISVYISGNELEKFSFNAGQFMIVRFLTRGMWWQAHPFSLSMMPNGRELRITAKEVGDFTGQMKHLKQGTKIIIDGPYGVFTNLFAVSEKVLLVAGGIGITPIRSLMEDMLAHGKDVVLLYANKTEKDIIFKKELDDLKIKYPARVVHVLSHDAKYKGERGYIDEEKIKRIVPDAASREVFVCGPKPMMDAIVALAQKIGIQKSKIHFEKFSL